MLHRRAERPATSPAMQYPCKASLACTRLEGQWCDALPKTLLLLSAPLIYRSLQRQVIPCTQHHQHLVLQKTLATGATVNDNDAYSILTLLLLLHVHTITAAHTTNIPVLLTPRLKENTDGWSSKKVAF